MRSGTCGLNEEPCRHSGREGRKGCILCDDECESISSIESPIYSTLRNDFMCKFLGMHLKVPEHFIVFFLYFLYTYTCAEFPTTMVT